MCRRICMHGEVSAIQIVWLGMLIGSRHAYARTSVARVDYPPFHTGTRPGLYPSFGIHTGTLTRVRPGLNPGSRPCLRAGFRPGFATRLRHNRIVSVKKWRKTDERGLSARRGCFCRSGARIGSSVSCRGSKEQCSISDDCRRAGKARLSAHARVMSAENKSSQEEVQVHR